jgi:hypothetical protein
MAVRAGDLNRRPSRRWENANFSKSTNQRSLEKVCVEARTTFAFYRRLPRRHGFKSVNTGGSGESNQIRFACVLDCENSKSIAPCGGNAFKHVVARERVTAFKRKYVRHATRLNEVDFRPSILRLRQV